MTQSTHEIELPGCTPTPLAGYLKALAVLRLVAEQAGDPQVRGCWRDEVFVLKTRLSRDELLRFFLDEYSPTPLVAPWGARSGFYEGSSEATARATLVHLLNSSSQRLRSFREAITTVKALLQKHGLGTKPTDEQKLGLLRICRNELPDELLQWLDACYVLTNEGRGFPPLLGTGGNEGSGSYVSGFAQQVLACVAERRHDDALGASLFAFPTPGTISGQTPGHFSPPASAGANASTGFEGDARLNPWDFLLALEGTLLFAGAATRRGETGVRDISFPFVSKPLATGAQAYSAKEERPTNAKRQVFEIWLPLWRRMLSIGEAAALFSEGRATRGSRGRTAVNGLDFARAIAGLGIDRGIDQFQRFAFLMRNGLSFFAVPIERLNVPAQRSAAGDLIDELERHDWLTRVQRHARDDTAPASIRSLGAQLDAALFALTQRGDRQSVQRVLQLVGRIDGQCAISPKTRDALPPVPALSAAWAVQADDGSAEFRIACALAALSMEGSDGGRPLRLGLRPHLVPVSSDGLRWSPESHLPCWGHGSLERNLAALLHRRRMEAARLGVEGETLAGRIGASLHDVRLLLEGRTDDERIAGLMAGLACVQRLPQPLLPDQAPSGSPPTAYALLKPFFCPESALHDAGWLPTDRTMRLPPEVPGRLRSGDVRAAVSMAWLRMQGLGKRLPGREAPACAGASGPRLLAALLIPLTRRDLAHLLSWLDVDARDLDATPTPSDTTTS